MRKSLEYALGMPSPNSIYGCILAPPRDMDTHLNLKFRLYTAGKCSSLPDKAQEEDNNPKL